MYMFVFVTLMVALIGAYAQIYTKQAAIGYAQQSGVASAMIAWHSTAVDLAKKYVKPASITATGCTLTTVNTTAPLPPALSFCVGNVVNAYVGMPKGTSNLCSGAPATATPPGTPPCVTLLPAGYLATPYTFYSIVYSSSGINYVLTYVQQPTDSYNIGLLCLPGNIGAGACTQVSSTYKALYKGMGKNPLLSPMNYGTVTSTTAASGVLTTPSIKALFDSTTSAAKTYTVPGSAIIPLGSIGIISEFQACAGC